MAISTLVFVYLTGERGISAGVPAIAKILSSAPTKDQSEGEAILSYSHDVEFSSPEHLAINFAPDSKSFIASNKNHEIKHIDIASGTNINKIDEIRAEIYNVDWSKDGRFFALSTDGDLVSPATFLPRKYNHIRLYSLPEYKLLGEFEYRERNCFVIYEKSIIFSSDGKNLWIRCGHDFVQPKPNEIFAIKLDIPSMKISEVNPYDMIASNGVVEDSPMIKEDFTMINDAIVYWQKSYGSNSIFFYDLTNNKDINIPDLSKDNLAGKLYFSGKIKDKDSGISLSFSGKPTDVSDPTAIDTDEKEEALTPYVRNFYNSRFSRTLVFDIKSGELLKKTDYINRRRSLQSAEITDPQDKIRVEAQWQENSKTGEINVFDIATGQKKQHITTFAQRPLAFSPDGKWLVMYALDKKILTMYRVKE